MAQFYADRVAIGSHRAKTPEGYLLCKDIPFARTGTQRYKAKELGINDDGIVTVYRKFEEVFSPATIASFEGKTVTSPHPPRMLDPDNDAQHYKGHIQNIRQGGELADGEYALIGDILIKDGLLIAQIESGAISELSAGYECLYETDEHSPDLYYQVSIRGNHVAVVPSGRAGGNIKILDAIDKEEAMAETAVVVPPAADDRVSVGALTGLIRLLGLGRTATVDSESEAVKRNEEVAEKSKERAVKRNEDEKEEKPAKDKKTKDADEEEEKAKKKETTDAIRSAVRDAMKAYDEEKEKEKKEAEDAECSCGAEKGETHDEDCKMYSKDSDLIPVKTLAKEDQPKNPIPGADKMMDCLMRVKSIVADHGTADEINEWNAAYRSLKKIVATNDGYKELGRAKRPEVVNRAEELANIRPTNDEKVAEATNDFLSTAEHFRGKNPKDAAAELAATRAKGGK